MKLFFIGVVVMILLDFVWIGGFMSGFYKDNLKYFLRFNDDGNLLPRIVPTLLVYVAGSAILGIFVLPMVRASLASGNGIFVASLWGALAGLLVYVFYDFTNLALFEKWGLMVSLIDVVWGTVLFYLTTLVLVWIM